MKIYMNNHVHPVLRDIINQFAVETLTPVRPMSELEPCYRCEGSGMVEFVTVDYGEGGQEYDTCECPVCNKENTND